MTQNQLCCSTIVRFNGKGQSLLFNPLSFSRLRIFPAVIALPETIGYTGGIEIRYHYQEGHNETAYNAVAFSNGFLDRCTNNNTGGRL
jgi:hypothetical protein